MARNQQPTQTYKLKQQNYERETNEPSNNGREKLLLMAVETRIDNLWEWLKKHVT